MIYSGTLILESLHDESILNFVQETGRRIDPRADATADQPKQFTVVSFTIRDEMTPAVADELSRLLKPGWYADFGNEYDKYVVFKNKVFRYAPKELEKKQRAIDYGKSLGIPETQLDWK